MKIDKKFILSFFIFIALLNGNPSGGYPGAFLNMRVSPTSKSMGGIGVALPLQTGPMYSNPAGLAIAKQRQAEFNYFFLSLDREMNYIGYSTPIEPAGGIGLAWIHSGVDNIQGRNNMGLKTKKYQTGQDVFLISLSTSFSEKLSLGVSAKILRNNMLDITGTGVGIDIGALYRVSSNLTFGLNLRDVNSGYQWKTNKVFGQDDGQSYKEKFPLKGLAGIAWSNSNYTVSYDLEYTSKGVLRNHIGAEYNYNESAYLRAGFDNLRPTFGGGLKYKIFNNIQTNLDYCFLIGTLGQGETHIFSWKFLF